jgi:hypothetical protein
MRSAISLTFPLRYLNKIAFKTFVLSYYAPTRVKIVQILFPEERKKSAPLARTFRVQFFVKICAKLQ